MPQASTRFHPTHAVLTAPPYTVPIAGRLDRDAVNDKPTLHLAFLVEGWTKISELLLRRSVKRGAIDDIIQFFPPTTT